MHEENQEPFTRWGRENYTNTNCYSLIELSKKKIAEEKIAICK